MIFSEKSLHRWLLLLTLGAVCGLAPGCSRNVPADAEINAHSKDAYGRPLGDSSDATFVVDQPVKLISAQTRAEDRLWSLPSQATLTFEACLKDVGKLEGIVGHRFAIEAEDGRHEATTDTDGCLTWTENVPFDFLQEETYVESVTTIEGLGPHLGARHLPLAIDPWAKDGSALVDLRQTKVTKLAQGNSVAEALRSAQRSSQQDGRTRTRTDFVIVEANDDRTVDTTGTIRMRLVMSPMMTRKNLAGSEILEPIYRGNFQLDTTLVERRRGDREDQLIILSEQSMQVSSEKGTISVDVPLTLKRMPNRSAILELAFELRPLDAPFEILPQQGIIQVPGLKGGGRMAARDLPETLAVYLRKANADTEAFASQVNLLTAPSAVCSDGSRDLGFYLSSVDVRNMGTVDRSQQAGVPTQVKAAIEVCLKNSMDQKAVADHPFEIRWDRGTERQTTRTLVSESDGCLRWTEDVDFDYFESEEFLKKDLEIVSRVAPFRDVAREFPVYLDPWQKDPYFFWNCRRGERPEFKTGPARVEMIDFSYGYLGRALEIDRLLNLTVTRHYQMQFTPKLHRKTGYSGQDVYEDLPDGNYHLRVLLLSPNRDESFSKIEGADTKTVLSNFKYLSSYENDIRTRAGRVVEEVSLPVDFRELPLLASHNLLLVELAPMDPESKLISHPFYLDLETADAGGFMAATSTAPDRTFVSNDRVGASELNLASLIELGRKAKAARLGTGSVASFSKQLSLHQPSDQELKRVGINDAVIRSLVSRERSSDTDLRRLCALLGDPMPSSRKSALTPCMKNPRSQLVMALTQHVEAIEGRPEILDSSYKTLNVNANFSVSNSSSQSTSDGAGTNSNLGVSATAGGGFNLFGFFKAGADVGWNKGKNWFKSTSVTISRGTGISSGATYSRNFAVEELKFGIPAGSRFCLSVRKKDGKTGVVLCQASVSRSKQLVESYYLVTEILGSPASPLRDVRSQKERPWMRAIRGKTAFDSLRKTLENKGSELMVFPDQGDPEDLEKTKNLFDGFADTTPPFSDGAFPSMIQ